MSKKNKFQVNTEEEPLYVKKEEAFTGIIKQDTPKLIPCQCPNCNAIFLLHTDVIPLSESYGPCPNCNKEHTWAGYKISKIKYKFLRYWRMRDGEA